ncbi:MAG: flagellar biosynthesis anti-sigma factor FlgM [Acidobacteriia bacterium]|nr:flagellar biosynthesis anti-sigma factor FlgM [Terriglobia bacterium]
MRINLDHGAQQLPESSRSGTTSPQAATAAGSSSAAAALGQDQAQFSGAHAQVQALAAQAAQLPEVRSERVQALRQALINGSYHRSAEEVAGAVLSHMIAGPAA